MVVTGMDVAATTFSTKTIASSTQETGATNTITVGLVIDTAALAANDVIVISMGANKFQTADGALTIGGGAADKFSSTGAWLLSAGTLTLTVGTGQAVAANTAIAITFDLQNVDVVQAALAPTVAGTVAAAAGDAIASANMVVTGMDVAGGDCTVPTIAAGAASWTGANCASAATNVASGTTCAIVASTGYTCTNPGLCTAGTFAATGACTANAATTTTGAPAATTTTGAPAATTAKPALSGVGAFQPGFLSTLFVIVAAALSVF